MPSSKKLDRTDDQLFVSLNHRQWTVCRQWCLSTGMEFTFLLTMTAGAVVR